MRSLSMSLWLMLLIMLLRASSPAAAQGAPVAKVAGSSGKTTCSLNIQGNSAGDGIKSASLICSGSGTVTVAVHQQLEEVLVLKGVETVSAAKRSTCELTGDPCLLLICRSDADFISPVINGVKFVRGVWGVLCFDWGSKITLHKGRFTSSGMPNIGIFGFKTSVLIDQCTFQGNSVYRNGAGLLLNGGTLRVQSSTFKGNTATVAEKYNGGAMYLQRGSATVVDSLFHSNEANNGGAIFLIDTATVSIQGSQFVGNMAGSNGAAISAEGTAQVDILPAAMQAPGASKTTFSNNTAKRYGGDIIVFGSASLHAIGATFSNGAAQSGGSIYTYSNVTLERCNITAARATDFGGGCLFADGKSIVRLVNVVLSACKSVWGGGGLSAQNWARMTVTDSKIERCSAGRNGGGIWAGQDSTLELDNARVSGNTAVEGGGLYLVSAATLQLLGTSVFQYNNASYIGGGLRLQSSGFKPKELPAHVESERNSAYRGFNADISMAAKAIEMFDPGNADNYIPSANGGDGLRFTLNVSGPHGLPSDDEVTMIMLEKGTNNKVSEVKSWGNSGDNLRKVSINPQALQGEYILEATVNILDGVRSVKLDVQVLPCPRGSVATGNNNTCITCVAGLYSFDPTASKACSICGANFECPGGDVVWPDPKYWHSAPYSTQMHRCFNPDACIGGAAANKTTDRRTDFKAAQCSGPYKGNLCGECKQGFGRVRPFHCRKCMSAGAIIALYLLAALAVIGLVKLLVYFTTSADLGSRTDLQTPTPSEMLRALVIHSQWLYIICNLVGVPWPAALTVPMQVIGGIWASTSGSSIGFDCVLRKQGVPIAVQKLLICLFTPVGILFAVLAIEGVVRYVRQGTARRGRAATTHHHFASVAMCIVFMFLPTWVNTALSLFTCIPLDKSVDPPLQADAVGSWWVEDMSQLCYSRSGYHRRWALGLGIPLTLLFCVALPVGVFVFMWYSRKQGKLQDMQFQKHYGFMYRLWRDKWCWWEAVVIFQTICLVMVSTFGYAVGPFYQTILTTAVLAAVGMLLLAVKPFKCPTANKVAVASVCILCFTAYSALTFLPCSYNGMTPGPVYGNMMGVVLVLLNLAFLGGTVWKLLRVIDWAAVKSFAKGGCCKGGGGMPDSIHGIVECRNPTTNQSHPATN